MMNSSEQFSLIEEKEYDEFFRITPSIDEKDNEEFFRITSLINEKRI